MAIHRKRTLIVEEIDDATNSSAQTSAPVRVGKSKRLRNLKAIETGSTAAGDSDEDPIANGDMDAKPSQSRIGRTVPDLVVEFKNDARFVTVLLFFIPIPFFATSMVEFGKSFFVPFAVGAVLNCIWLLVGWLQKKFSTAVP